MTKFEVFGLANETLSQVFDISSQSKQKLRSKQRNKIIKIYMLIRTGIQTSNAVMIFFVLHDELLMRLMENLESHGIFRISYSRPGNFIRSCNYVRTVTYNFKALAIEYMYLGQWELTHTTLN